MWQKNPTSFLRVTLLGAKAICGLLLSSSLLLAQADRATSAAAAGEPQGRSTNPATPTSGQTQDSPAIGNISGTVLDATGTPASGAKVRLTRLATTPAAETLTEPNGHFSFTRRLTCAGVSAYGFKPKTVSGNLPAKEDYLRQRSRWSCLQWSPTSVRLTTEEIAKNRSRQEQQKPGGNPQLRELRGYRCADDPKQKLELAWKLVIASGRL